MEIKQLVKMLKKYAYIILMFAIFGLIIAFILTRNHQQGVKVEQLFLIPPPSSNLAEPSTAGSFYYGQEAARNYTDTAVAILESPDFALGIANNSQITARKVAPQIIRITVGASNQASAQAHLNQAVSAFNQNAQLKLTPIGQSAQLVPQRASMKIMLSAGVLTGTIFALLVISLKEYFKV